MRLTNLQRILMIAFVAMVFGICQYLDSYHNDNLLERSPRVWCDETLPLNELVDCVDNLYQSSRTAEIWKRLSTRRPSLAMATSREAFALAHPYREVESFPILKPKYYQIAVYNGQANLVVADNLEDLNLIMPQLNILGFVIQSPHYSDESNKCKISMDNVLVSEAFANWKYPGHRPYFSKDMLITKVNGKYKIYAVSYEAVRLKGDKALFVVSIANFCPVKEKFDYCGTDYLYFTDSYHSRKDYLENITVSEEDKARFLNCPPYPRQIRSVLDEAQPEKDIILSADSRFNPQKLYVKVNNRIFEIKLDEKEKNND